MHFYPALGVPIKDKRPFSEIYFFQDSNSDWDSLSGDEELEPPSVSVAVESSRQIKQPPHVDPIEQHVSPSLAKSPLSRTNKEPRAPPRTSEKYRNTANRGQFLRKNDLLVSIKKLLRKMWQV